LKESYGFKKVEKARCVVEGEDRCEDDLVGLLARDRRSLDILSVKRKAKLPASEKLGADEGKVEEDLRCSSLLTVCQSRLRCHEEIRLQ